MWNPFGHTHLTRSTMFIIFTATSSTIEINKNYNILKQRSTIQLGKILKKPNKLTDNVTFPVAQQIKFSMLKSKRSHSITDTLMQKTMLILDTYRFYKSAQQNSAVYIKWLNRHSRFRKKCFKHTNTYFYYNSIGTQV